MTPKPQKSDDVKSCESMDSQAFEHSSKCNFSPDGERCELTGGYAKARIYCDGTTDKRGCPFWK